MGTLSVAIVELYDRMPPWIVGVAILITAGSFLLAARSQYMGERMCYLWPLTLGAAGSVALLGLVYILASTALGFPDEVFRGTIRIMLLVSSFSLTVYNSVAAWLGQDSNARRCDEQLRRGNRGDRS